MANSINSESIFRSVCYQMLEAARFSWEKQVELFHTQLAQLVGLDRAIRLAELVIIEHQQLLDQATWN